MKTYNVSQSRAKKYLLVFILAEVLFLLASMFSLYPEEFLTDNPIMIFSNSIFWSGALSCSLFLLVNPYLLIANNKALVKAQRPGSGARYLPLFHIGNVLMIAGVIYGYFALQ